MSETQSALPVIMSMKLKEGGNLKVKVYLPPSDPAYVGHELTLAIPVLGSGIGEPNRQMLANALERLGQDVDTAIMRLRGLR
ncbi:hypothetical protein [Gluconobacter kondonii]|nr:hypothetical protein [Gluconobacter kondonii]